MSSKRRAVAALLCTALVPVVGGCSGPTDGATARPPSVTTPAAPAPSVAPSVRPIETATPVVYDRDAKKAEVRNEIGEPWRLDAGGAIACARAEFAFRSPETGGDLATELRYLRSAVRTTKSSALRAAVAALPTATAAADVRTVLGVCTAMGYQL